MAVQQIARTAPGLPQPIGLSHAFSGDHAWCREKMMLADELAGGVALATFFKDGGFERAIDRYTEVTKGTDRRAVVSMWSLYYFAGISIPYLLAHRLAGQVLPVAFDEMTIALTEDGLPRAFGVSHRGMIGEETSGDEFSVVGPLMSGHLNMAVERLKRCGLSAKLLWNNAAVYIDYTLRLTDSEGGGRSAPDLPLFVRGCLPDGGPNPLCGSVKRVEEDGQMIQRRKLCCLRYMLPGVASCGSRCALPSQRNPQ
ncbi:siderophore-iron reductase FhuF [Rhizobium sp. 2MFCol3.1]|uniref:siderophore-iron reductase FhuF n=1 Tax=Rhizobium sp. 2MFCol3.1 TaxID=1246459 RepID=UPI00036FE4C9|nr:siderophore-iron reductase FhuF [Rhizobium sp. 2MFCol3.1]